MSAMTVLRKQIIAEKLALRPADYCEELRATYNVLKSGKGPEVTTLLCAAAYIMMLAEQVEDLKNTLRSIGRLAEDRL